MGATESWRSMFENWPEAIPRQGMLVTNYNEQIPFADFLIAGGIVLLDRAAPDTQGARKVMIAYEAISAIKFTSVIELARFQVMGFQSPM